MNPGMVVDVELERSEASATLPDASPRPVAAASLYRVVWRWHFYAGILIAPILLVVAITGALYIFRSEIEDYNHARLRFVVPGDSRLKAGAQVDLAKAAHPGMTPSSLELSSDPARASIVRFGEGRRKAGPSSYVDPYRGVVLGSVGAGTDGRLARFFDFVLKLHRRLFLGIVGRVVVELSVGWTIILLATGLYLWWPKRGGRSLGVWKPRLRAKPYVVLRDLHTVFGFYLLVPATIITATGLFYTQIWSEGFYRVSHGQLHGAATKSASKANPAAISDSEPKRPTLSIDRVEEIARARYPDRNLAISLVPKPGSGFEVRASNDFNNSRGEYVSAQFVLDPQSGEMTSHKTLAEDDRHWWHGWVYPLHVGSVFGTTTKLIWLIACLILAALPVTGIWMWLKRRPAGRTGFPSRPERRVPVGLVILIVILGLVLPVAGVSMILIVTGEWIVQLIRRARSGRPTFAGVS